MELGVSVMIVRVTSLGPRFVAVIVAVRNADSWTDGLGNRVLLTAKSAEGATMFVEAVARLLLGLGSAVVELIVTVLVMVEPTVAVRFTWTTTKIESVVT